MSRFLDDPLCRGDHKHTGGGRQNPSHIETHTATVSTPSSWLQEDHNWPGLAAIGKIDRVRETASKTTTETAYYLLSTALSGERFNEVA